MALVEDRGTSVQTQGEPAPQRIANRYGDEPSPGVEIPHAEFAGIWHRISELGPVLAKYVHKYFYDVVGHVCEFCVQAAKLSTTAPDR